MSPQEYARIQEYFLRLREQDETQRAQLLAALEESAEAAAGLMDVHPLEDPDNSIPILKSLLEANATEDSPLDHPVAQLPSVNGLCLDQTQDAGDTTQEIALPNDPNTPHSIGPYRILQKIGEGGHGLVFMAAQRTPIQRKVAVKLIKPGMESKTILARFEAERQALAMMRHPSIANVIDAGTSESGSPYFVMELVHGIPIDQFCHENRLGLRDLLGLFQQVCDAVHHAHRKGIIHRDIKPANVLVTVESGKPLAKVIDFGIAKAMHLSLTDKTMFTQYGQIVGTLEYMSPEQALMSQDVADVRSDVYSLGALLYVLLTGSPPISRDKLLEHGIFELPKVINDIRPPTPSLRLTGKSAAKSWREQTEFQERSWSSHLRGDLDWITMKALAKELELRYDSVAAFSSDIDRFLCNEEIQARPPSLRYTVSKWVVRHRVAALVSACLLCAGLVSFGAVAWGYYQSQENLEEIRAANSIIEEKANALSESLDEVQTQRSRADTSARQMAVMLKRELLQSSWEKALSGDSEGSQRQLERVEKSDRDYAWQIVDSVRTQLDWPSLRTEADGAIRQVTVHDTAATFAVITTESTLEIWDLKTLALKKSLRLPQAIYSSVAFSDAGERLLVGASDWVQNVDLASNKVGERLVHGRGGTRDATYDRKRGLWLVTTGANFLLSLNADTMQLKGTLQLPARVRKVSVSPDLDWAAVASLSGDVFLVDLSNLRFAATLSQAGLTVNDMKWIGDVLIGVDRRGNQTAWTIPTAKEIADSEPTLVISGQTFVNAQDSQWAQTADAPNGVEVQGEAEMAIFGMHSSQPVTPTNTSDGQRTEPQPATGAVDAESKPPTHPTMDSFAVRRKSEVFMLDRSANGRTAKVPIRRFAPAIASLHWLPNTEMLLVEHFNGRVNIITREFIERRRNYATQLKGLNDGLCLAETNTSVTAHRDGRLITWDTQSGAPLTKRNLGGAEIFSIDAHEESRRVVSYGDQWSIRVADVDSLEEVWTAATSYGVRSVAISNNGRTIAGAPSRQGQEFVREGTFDLWEMDTGLPKLRCVGHTNWVLQFLFDSHDTKLYSLAVDGTIRRWNTETGLSDLEIDFAQQSPVSVIGLLEKANSLICGHQDGSLSLRNLQDGSLVASIPMQNDSVTGLIVCADERFAIVCTESQTTLTCVDTADLSVAAVWNPRVGLIKGIRCDRSKSRLQILGEGIARILELPPPSR
ncbi:MAG TPA: hypothetical protein DDW52_19450 [Planctomycetaceae bacterium]|nr:hypothetical protein [Planctomycetaceae bacterium]